MQETFLLEFTVKGLFLVLLLSMPPIILATVVGLMVSLFQALTQIQEQTLSFGVKLIVVTLSLVLTAHWMGGELLTYTNYIFQAFPYITSN
ncbi:MAG TPA: type III secretion system export apparatus subunit SctS [Opitutales bacterium]|nr:type III secretion system export apparatus subunit SctS [Opitutales bacterium]